MKNNEYLNNIYDVNSNVEKSPLLLELPRLEKEKEDLECEVIVLDRFIKEIETLLNTIEKNHLIALKVRNLELEMNNKKMFTKDRKEIKDEIKLLNSEVVDININNEIKRIEDAFVENYINKYPSNKGLDVLFNLGLGNIHMILEEIYNKKLSHIELLSTKIEEIKDKQKSKIKVIV